ncbi:hypothetical protein ABID21_000808 [Pseudorhizobium tarimense]|uniref:Uncharacterized protein n=1 Tax=Pseudorhizobium tarimense TaxID=1079109 RepID=A0ABV2H2F2_9HYPH|nr:hypothetical protein [Pseudorhizobium tarimense]MCJ8517679.1 hypothetical protein [Pseudorhizobium tarimense]
MTKKPKKKAQNAAQIRGDIQRGLTGDKRPGFDPAASPLETDSEAGGAPLSAEEVATARATQRQPGPQQRSRNFDTAMRWHAPELHKRRPSLPALLPLIAVLLIGLAVLIGLALR